MGAGLDVAPAKRLRSKTLLGCFAGRSVNPTQVLLVPISWLCSSQGRAASASLRNMGKPMPFGLRCVFFEGCELLAMQCRRLQGKCGDGEDGAGLEATWHYKIRIATPVFAAANFAAFHSCQETAAVAPWPAEQEDGSATRIVTDISSGFGAFCRILMVSRGMRQLIP